MEPLGDGATAYRIVDASGVASHRVAIVRMPGHLIEIRIPAQSPEPPGDMAVRLRRVARAAYERAAATLGRGTPPGTRKCAPGDNGSPPP